MSSLLLEIFIAILASYLTFTNFLAQEIQSFLPSEAETMISEEISEPESNEVELTKLPSSYEYGGIIPRILIDNAAYQKASVIESQVDETEGTPKLTNQTEAIVNIYCTYKTDDFIRTTTGSGFLVSDDGVVLTNAHVAQFLLLENLSDAGVTDCVVRTGEIAIPAFEAELLYISPAWIHANADLISQAEPKGTGERDYALLYVSRGIDNKPVPANLPFIKGDTSPLDLENKDNTVTLGGYPVKTGSGDNTESNLTQELATTTIAEIYTFSSGLADIMNLRGTAIGEHGVSGGPVINESGEAIGLISTKSDDKELGAGSLNAITLSYIDRTMQEETGVGWGKNISGNLPYRAELFKSTIVPFLTQILAQEL